MIPTMNAPTAKGTPLMSKTNRHATTDDRQAARARTTRHLRDQGYRDGYRAAADFTRDDYDGELVGVTEGDRVLVGDTYAAGGQSFVPVYSLTTLDRVDVPLADVATLLVAA